MGRERINFKFLFIGDGELKEETERILKEERLDEYAIFAGSVNNVYDYINAMDVFVLPSLYEGLPVTLIEAQANGIPCLVSTNVAKESKITSLVFFKKLTDSINEWSKKIVELSAMERKDEMTSIIESGYEIQHATKSLQDKYIKLINVDGKN